MALEFQAVLDAARRGLPATLELEVEGRTYVRSFRPGERLILLGAGHVAQPLCTFAAALGFAVTVVDDRPSFANRARFPEAEAIVCNAFPAAIASLGICGGDYVAVITRGHRYDADCLRAILPGTMPYYLGMIGSKRRTVGLLNLLEEEGFPRPLLEEIYTPIGLEIGALTTQEIGISVVAQLIQRRRGRTNRRSESTVLTSEEIDLPRLRSPRPKYSSWYTRPAAPPRSSRGPSWPWTRPTAPRAPSAAGAAKVPSSGTPMPSSGPGGCAPSPWT